MSEECGGCGQEPPQDPNGLWENRVALIEDEFVFGYNETCSVCGSRINPLEIIEEEDDDVKFLEGEDLAHGME